MSLKSEGALGVVRYLSTIRDVAHPIYWSSRKLRRVARSTSTAEILAAADAVDMALYLAAVTD